MVMQLFHVLILVYEILSLADRTFPSWRDVQQSVLRLGTFL